MSQPIEITKIVTHPGSAHKDEFLAICLASHMTGCTQIERRVVTDADLSDPSVMVIDIGRQYNPALNNFDHHHDASLNSSYALVARHLGLEKALKLSDKAYDTVDIEDREGPVKSAGRFGLSVAEYNALSDPIGVAMLSSFSDYQQVPKEMAVVMQTMGKNMVARAQEYQPDYERLQADMQIKEVDSVRYYVDTQDKSVAREDFAREHDVAIIVSPNSRDGGWKFKRIDDHPRVDFRNAKSLEELDPAKSPKSFIHANGFLAVTTKADADIEKIIAASLQPTQAQSLSGKYARRVGVDNSWGQGK
jgi:hypothetical protein